MIPDWQTLFAPRPLSERAVRLALGDAAGPVWFAATGSADLVELMPEKFLTSTETARASQFKFGPPRENFTLGRLAAKLALVACAGRHPKAEREGKELARWLRSIEIGNGERGEPVVRPDDSHSPPALATDATDGDRKSPAPGISLSHVNGRGVAVAFPHGRQVGLDLELIDGRRAQTVREAVPLSPAEAAWLRSAALPEATALLLLWTAREALGKALGCGLACAWETLALAQIQPSTNGTWVGRYFHHSALRCRSWVGADSVLSVAWDEAKT